jgi:hypothetical protein
MMRAVRRPAQRAIFEESCSSFNYTNSFSARGPDRSEMDDGVYQVGRHGWNNNYRMVPRAYFSYFIVTSGFAVAGRRCRRDSLRNALPL